MKIMTATDLGRVLQDCPLLDPPRKAALARDLLPRFPSGPALLRELLRRGWLTPLQHSYLVEGRVAELFPGGYVILDKLGEGAMGAVFKASEPRKQRTVVVKFLHRDLVQDERMRRRFQREVAASTRLHHPNVVATLDHGEADGRPYFVMEYVPGQDLADRVADGGPLPVAVACDYVRQAALGLQHAHDNGLIHRDVKPSNLMVTAAGAVKLLDLGLCRLRENSGVGGGVELTRQGAALGTPEYMAPEQARDSTKVDIRADLYSLGCTLYYLLAGRPPFLAPAPLAVVRCQLLDEPPPIDRFRPDVPAAVRAVVHRLLSKAPAERYQTPAELARALHEVAAQLDPAFTSSVPPVPARARATRGRLRRSALLAAGVGLLLAAGGLAALLLK
jgi:serine/threonine-protein kinase